MLSRISKFNWDNSNYSPIKSKRDSAITSRKTKSSQSTNKSTTTSSPVLTDKSTSSKIKNKKLPKILFPSKNSSLKSPNLTKNSKVKSPISKKSSKKTILKTTLPPKKPDTSNTSSTKCLKRSKKSSPTLTIRTRPNFLAQFTDNSLFDANFKICFRPPQILILTRTTLKWTMKFSIQPKTRKRY